MPDATGELRYQRARGGVDRDKSWTKAETIAAFGPSTGTASRRKEGGDSFAIEEQKRQQSRRDAATKRRYMLVAGGERMGRRTEE